MQLQVIPFQTSIDMLALYLLGRYIGLKSCAINSICAYVLYSVFACFILTYVCKTMRTCILIYMYMYSRR